MSKGRAKEILDLTVSICSIVSCIVAVYGVFKVVDFVVEVKPIAVFMANEVKEGNLDAKNILNGSRTTVRHDTVRVRDSIYLPSDKMQEATSLTRMRQERGLTSAEEARLGKSVDNVSEEDKRDINLKESKFRQDMKDKMNR